VYSLKQIYLKLEELSLDHATKQDSYRKVISHSL